MDSVKKPILYMISVVAFGMNVNCYKPNIINSKNQKDMGTLNDQTTEKREGIKKCWLQTRINI